MSELPVVDDRGNAFFIEFENDDSVLVTTKDRKIYVHTVNGTYEYITAPFDLARALASKLESGFRRITAGATINLNAVTVEPVGKDILLHFPPVGKRKIKSHEVTRRNVETIISYLEDKGKI